jgi:methanethiol S-methyltransferase
MQDKAFRIETTAARPGTLPAQTAGLATRVLGFAYGLVAYALFVGVFLYAIGFIGNFGVPKAMDSGRETTLGYALLINALLLGVFAVQHSVMARSWFKRWLTRVVPHQLERSTYVMLSNLAMILLFWQWQPMGGTIWEVHNATGRAILLGLFAAGYIQVLIASFFINHFDLFGMRQAYSYLRGKEYTPLRFATPGHYKHVRHPLYVGWLLGFWATPTMTAAHLLFALMTTAYILVAIQFEERDLVTIHGKDYADYRKRVPMLIPRLFGKQAPQKAADTSAA